MVRLLAFLVQGDPPAPEPTVFIQQPAGCEGGWFCEQVLELTDSQTTADLSAFFVETPLRILLLVLAGLVVVRVLRRAVRRLASRVVKTAVGVDELAPGTRTRSPEAIRRAEQRAETLATVLRSLIGATVWTIVILIILGELGINLAPLIAGAGVVGVAVGFGAQSLVKDLIAGFFMLLENQYGVGDFVDLGDASGVIERVNLRTTVIRDDHGTVWHIPNGTVTRIGNHSQLFSRAVLDIAIAYAADIDASSEIIDRVTRDLRDDPEWSDRILSEPEVLGVQNLAVDQVTIRVTIDTAPAQQWAVERELRHRIKIALDQQA